MDAASAILSRGGMLAHERPSADGMEKMKLQHSNAKKYVIVVRTCDNYPIEKVTKTFASRSRLVPPKVGQLLYEC